MFATQPEPTVDAIVDLAVHDLDAALVIARRHLRLHPEDAHVLGELAAVVPAESEAWVRFRDFIGTVIADALATERLELVTRASGSSPRPAKACA